ncbi:hypothetical protein GN244_ATG10779 [Phytophthora infestans]|uniref:Uncharacterized protein n=1 Tax=Phytophthora infestans TaxID=4787 RepID=A0A833SNG6_PHYIN|nr:hypothetical protein GN244_ATG10779 [Phytophthora infestans]KAF4146499.1 hypothetical protein GN958_ATG04272 [Phytophthora infestans]
MFQYMYRVGYIVADQFWNLESLANLFFNQCQTASAQTFHRPGLREQLAFGYLLHTSFLNPFVMQGIFTLAFLVLNSWLGTGVEAVDAAHAAGPAFVGGAVVVNNCKNCKSGPTMHPLLKHADDSDQN